MLQPSVAEPGANPAAGSGQKVGQESEWGVARANSLASLSIYYLSLSLFLVGFLHRLAFGLDSLKHKRVNGASQRANSLPSLSIHYLSLSLSSL